MTLYRIVFPTDDPQQAHRIRRLMMAAGASAMVVALLYVAYRLDVLTLRTFVNAALLTLFFVIAFYAVFRSGLNLHFRDASLTMPQIVASMLVILYVLQESPSGHGVLSSIFLVSFLFGVFRLSTRQLLGLTAFVALSYGSIIILQWHPEVVRDETRRNVLNWIVLISVLAFFSVMGGYISRLRKEIAESKAQLEDALQRIKELAARDELTGVFNRRSLLDVLKQQKSRADRYGKTFSVLMIDIDHFKRINDTYGHQVGDEVLRIFARAAASSLRGTDVFGRYGGEEFLAIAEQTVIEQSSVVAERLCELARKLVFAELASGLHISVSIGGAEYRPQEEWQETVARADKALYRAKQGGRDRVELAPTLLELEAADGRH